MQLTTRTIRAPLKLPDSPPTSSRKTGPTGAVWSSSTRRGGLGRCHNRPERGVSYPTRCATSRFWSSGFVISPSTGAADPAAGPDERRLPMRHVPNSHTNAPGQSRAHPAGGSPISTAGRVCQARWENSPRAHSPVRYPRSRECWNSVPLAPPPAQYRSVLRFRWAGQFQLVP
jgi:hypothetical protein